MEQTEMLQVNKKCWDVVAPHFFQVDCLPKYGQYTASEDEIHLFDLIENKTVLDIGCGSGHSLEYMAERGAMEEELNIPEEHFDIVYSTYALGWTSNLRKTLELIYSYLRFPRLKSQARILTDLRVGFLND
ncbi:hypothetical protein BWGOE2_33790 [Bacillus mycoides]|nr:hypothetical protein BWGOE2_33790 [Bacillus mycoides]OFD43771.1 hypothetical protein BWGOE1_33650 [Bacillus mycoides]